MYLNEVANFLLLLGILNLEVKKSGTFGCVAGTFMLMFYFLTYMHSVYVSKAFLNTSKAP